MSRPRLVPIDRPDVPPLSISERLRGQLAHFCAAGADACGPVDFHFDPTEVATWLDDGVIRVVSPLDTAGMTEVELDEEQETFLEWLRSRGVSRVRLERG